MAFSAAFYPTSTTVPKEPTGAKEEPGVIVDEQPMPAAFFQSRDKSDWVKYTMYNAPYIGIAGLAGGLQEAFYTFQKMPDSATRQTLRQGTALFSIVGKKYALATALGAVFCATDALVEQSQGQHDMTSGVVAGLVTGAAFGVWRPWPQILAWPFAFAGVAAGSDIVCETIPRLLKGWRYYGPVENRESWGDPAPPRPPVVNTGASARPNEPGHFWRGQ